MTQIDELVARVDALPDRAARAAAVELVQAVMSLHATALERVLELATAEPGIVAALATDDVVSRVLILHGIHPDDFNARFARAIDKLQRFFDSRGGEIDVLESSPERISLRFHSRRPGSAAAAQKVIEDAIYETVPEVGELIVEGAGEEQEPGFVPLESLLATQQA